MQNLINKVFADRYEMIGVISESEYSSVYKVKDTKTGNILALKNYFSSNPKDEIKLLEGLEREFNVLRHTSHPGLPKFFDLIKENDKFYLVMEYISGTNLKDYVDKNGPLKKKEMKHIMRQVGSTLYYLHSLEPAIIYRDLKPANIILLEDGGVKLVDFGIAKRYSGEDFLVEKAYGSRGFAAPEQYGDKNGNALFNTDIRTDIFGFGATMYYLATKEYYKSGHVTLRWGRKISRVISKCTKSNADDRYQNILDVLIDIA